MLADAEVADALFRRAVGCSVVAGKLSRRRGRIVRASVARRFPADVRACAFWLSRRRPDLWRAGPGGGA